MKTFKIILAGLFLLLTINMCYSQVFTVEEGTVATSGNTTISFHNTALKNNGNFNSASGAEAAFNSEHELSISGTSPVQFHNLTIQSDIDLQTDIQVDNILLIDSGMINLNTSDLYLNGEIIGERNTSRIYSFNSGEIVKTANIKANQTALLGNIGLEVTAATDMDNLVFKRGQISQTDGDNMSIERYFILPETGSDYNVSFNFFNDELNGLDAENLEIRGLINNVWVPFPTLYEKDRINFLEARISSETEKLTLFEPEESTAEISVPDGFSPNNDGINDYFIITGAENYPDNKLVIFNTWGDILLEKAPYENDWGGENELGVGIANEHILPDGTYFYVFFKDKNDKNSATKGFFELKAGK